MDIQFTEQQLALRDELRAYCGTLMTPELVAECERDMGEGGGPLWRWLAERRRRRMWSAEMQLEHVRTLVMMDHRWMAHDKTADALTGRYLKALSEDWHRFTTEDVRDLRERLGLCPHAARNAGDRA